MEKNVFTLALVFMFCLTIQAQSQHKKIIFKGLVNAKPRDTYGIFKDDLVNIGDTVYVEAIYNYTSQISNYTHYLTFGAKSFIKADSNYFRGIINNKYRVSYETPRIDAYSITKENNIIDKGKIIDKLTIFARGVNLPQNKMWSFCRMEVTLKDTSAKIWDNNELPLPDNLKPLINSFATIHIWGESNLQYTSDIEYLDVKATIFLIETSDYTLQTLLSSNHSEFVNSQSLSLTPNPSSTGLFRIEGTTNTASLKVYNLHGKAISPTFLDEHTLDLSSFPKGVYFVYSSSDGVVDNQKIIIE